jgi:hypothetical protein
MKLDQLPDDFTPEQFRQLDKESLDAVPYTRLRWLCQCKGCTNGTHVRDYGLVEFNPRGIWAFLDRNSKAAAKNPADYWMGPNNYWLCGKHNRLFKRLAKRFDMEHIWRRMLDIEKEVLVPVDSAHMATVKQIEKTGKIPPAQRF